MHIIHSEHPVLEGMNEHDLINKDLTADSQILEKLLEEAIDEWLSERQGEQGLITLVYAVWKDNVTSILFARKGIKIKWPLQKQNKVAS